MIHAVNRRMPLLVASVVMFALVLPAARASGGILVIPPADEVREVVYLSTLCNVSGSLLVDNEMVDFWVADPSGGILLQNDNVKNCSFSFVAKESGNYTMHLSNEYSTQNVTVRLSYGVVIKVDLQANVNVGLSSGVAKVVSPPPTTGWPGTNDDPRVVNKRTLFERFLNFLIAQDVLSIFANGQRPFPVRGMFLCLGLCVLAFAVKILGRKQSRLHIAKLAC